MPPALSLKAFSCFPEHLRHTGDLHLDRKIYHNVSTSKLQNCDPIGGGKCDAEGLTKLNLFTAEICAST
jgi:hypothetical protein